MLARKDSSSMMRDIYPYGPVSDVSEESSSMTRDIYPHGPVSDVSEERQF